MAVNSFKSQSLFDTFDTCALQSASTCFTSHFLIPLILVLYNQHGLVLLLTCYLFAVQSVSECRVQKRPLTSDMSNKGYAFSLLSSSVCPMREKEGKKSGKM